MPIVKSTTLKTATAAVTDLPMLAPEQVVEQLRALRQQIPEFVHLPKSDEMRQIRRIANLNPEFAHEGISTVGASDVVQRAIGNTPDELYQAEDEIGRWATVESELRSVLRGVTAANLVRRHRLGLAVLQAYNVSRQLVRQEEHAHLLPHVDRLTTLRKFGRRRANAASAPQAQPQPPDKRPLTSS